MLAGLLQDLQPGGRHSGDLWCQRKLLESASFGGRHFGPDARSIGTEGRLVLHEKIGPIHPQIPRPAFPHERRRKPEKGASSIAKPSAQET
jgi:hypothetical protein